MYNGSPQVPAASVETVHADICRVTVSGASREAGAHTAIAESLDNSNYKLSGTLTYQFTIQRKALTVTANDKEIAYGDAPSNSGVTFEGFVGGEGQAVLLGVLSYAYDYEQYGDTGTYTITPSGLGSDNYSIAYVDGTLTVSPAEITSVSVTGYGGVFDGTAHNSVTARNAVSVNSQQLTWSFRSESGEWSSQAME